MYRRIGRALKPKPTERKQLQQAPDEASKTQCQQAVEALELKRAWKIRNNVRQIAQKVKGSEGVWGYGLWYDNGTNGSFLNPGIEDLRQWDSSHVTFVGSYRHRGLETVRINPGCYGWYDFHWDRGVLWHYLDMHVLWNICGAWKAIPGATLATVHPRMRSSATCRICIRRTRPLLRAVR